MADPESEGASKARGQASTWAKAEHLSRRSRSGRGPWGYEGVVVVISLSLGALATLTAYHEAQHSVSTSYFPIFWVGQVVVLLSLGWVGLRRVSSSAGHLGLLAIYALYNYLPKLDMSLSAPIYFDEYGHFRQAINILTSGQLMPQNAYQPIIKDYPGLEWTTDIVHEVTRLSIWHSGQLVVGAAHILSLVAVWGISRRLGLSERASYLAAMIYGINPSYQYFDTQYSYESLGLSLALLVAYISATLATSTRLGPLRRRVVVALGIVLAAYVTVTHHISSWFGIALAGLLLTGITIDSLRQKVVPNLSRPLTIVGTNIVFVGLWIGIFARGTWGYISPHVVPAVNQLYESVIGHAATTLVRPSGQVTKVQSQRTLFSNSGLPTYEHLFAVGAPFLILIPCLAGLLLACGRKSRSYRLLTLSLLAAAYFVSLPFALTVAGSEGTHRSWAYSYVGVAIVAAAGCEHLYRVLKGRLRWVVPIVAVASSVIVNIGNVATGEDVGYRFPGPVAFGTDTRSVDREVLAMCSWLGRHVPTGTGVVTDRTTSEVIEGNTSLAVPRPGQWQAYEIYRLGLTSRAVDRYLVQNNFRLFVFDKRLAYDIPQVDPYAGYSGPESVRIDKVNQMSKSGYATVIYSSRDYEVFSLNLQLLARNLAS